MLKLVRSTFIAFWLVAVAGVGFFNVRLYCASPLAPQNNEAPPSLATQLAANGQAIRSGAPAKMQQLFPEGFYFCYLLHGLTWVELAMRDESFAPAAIAESLWCLDQLDSPAGREPFPSDLPPDHGMFYSAWKCSLRAGVVVLQKGRDLSQLNQLRRECDAIAAAITNAGTPFLPSYPNAAWPCDTVPAIHALTAYDRVTGEGRYSSVIVQWLIAARQRLDPQTGLLPHTAGLPDGRPTSVARATSQVIMLRYLPDIDPAFARSQYESFREKFVTTSFGVPCLLEYPAGISGPGDVDSGPLIAGRSPSATVMMMGIAQVYGDRPLADAIAKAGETVGLPWTIDGRKQYVGGILPIGDIIVAHSQVARPWFAGQEHQPTVKYEVSSLWRWKVHAFSMITLVPALFLGVRRWRSYRKQQADITSALPAPHAHTHPSAGSPGPRIDT